MVLSGILPKLGTYGLIRIAIPCSLKGSFLAVPGRLGVVNILYGSFVAFLQPDLKALVAYSSIGTLGFILLGAASGNAVGLNGAVFQQVSHGLYSALLFILVGVIAAELGRAASPSSVGSLQDAVGRRLAGSGRSGRDGAARARRLRLRVP